MKIALASYSFSILFVFFIFNLFLATPQSKALPITSPLAAPFNAERYNYLLWDGSDQPWFEWWYTKVTLPETQESFFVTLGIVVPEKDHTRPATGFLSIGDFNSKTIATQSYGLQQFEAKKNSLNVRLGETTLLGNHFSGRVNQHAFDFTIKKKWAFNAMGWGMFIPNLTNIGWFPAQADATCTGTFETLNQEGQPKVIRFTDAPCYQDRNWGKSFPKWWAWIVSNHFNEDPDAVLAVGGGRPEILGRDFYEGVSIGFKYKNKVYAFRPNDLAKIKAEICFGTWKVSAERQNVKIVIEAYAPPQAFMDLPFLTPQGNTFHDLETLNGSLTVQLYERANEQSEYKLVTKLTSDLAGIEYGDDQGQSPKLFQGCQKL